MTFPEILRAILKKNFSQPRVPDWGYPVFVQSVMLALVFTVEVILSKTDSPMPVTSLVGFSVMMVLMSLMCLYIPVLCLSRGIEDKVTGEYTGVGILLLAMISGIPLMLMRVSLHNILAWLWLRMDFRMVFPAFFFRGGTSDTTGLILSILTDTAVPGLGVCMFFYGLLWSRFRSTEKTMAVAVTALLYTLFSLNMLDAPAMLLSGVWFALLRGRSGNIFAPFCCMIGAKASELLLGSVLTPVDVTTIQTYSDIPQTFMYSSAPALFLGVVLLYFIYVLLNNFHLSYFASAHGTEEQAGLSEEDRSIPAFIKGLSPALLIGTLILIVLNILVSRGVHL